MRMCVSKSIVSAILAIAPAILAGIGTVSHTGSLAAAESARTKELQPLRNAMKRFDRAKIDVSDLKAILENYANDETSVCTAKCVTLWNSINRTAKNQGIESAVSFRTDAPGATVIVQTIGDREKNVPPRRLDSPTETTDRLPIGSYLVWTERDGKPTSQPQRFDIIDKSVTVRLTEGPGQERAVIGQTMQK